MAISSVGTLGGTASGTDNQTSLTHTIITNSPAAGNIVFVVVAVDNATTTSGASTDISSVTDSQGNTYTSIGQYTASPGGVGTGASCGLFFSVLTTGLTATTDTITANFTSSTASDASALTAWAFSVTAGNTLTQDGSSQFEATAADPGALAVSGLASAEHLWIRGIACEVSIAAPNLTPTANYTALTEAEVTGSSSTGMGAYGEWDVATATNSTSNPILTSNDNCSVFAAFTETALGGADVLDPFGMNGIYGI